MISAFQIDPHYTKWGIEYILIGRPLGRRSKVEMVSLEDSKERLDGKVAKLNDSNASNNS